MAKIVGINVCPMCATVTDSSYEPDFEENGNVTRWYSCSQPDCKTNWKVTWMPIMADIVEDGDDEAEAHVEMANYMRGCFAGFKDYLQGMLNGEFDIPSWTSELYIRKLAEIIQNEATWLDAQNYLLESAKTTFTMATMLWAEHMGEGPE